jgi:hypothetical protein
MTIYALDFWEHTLGVALVGWAVVLLLDVLTNEGSWWRAAIAGFLVGTAATMRTEAFVYGAVATAVVSGLLLIRRRRVVASMAVGLAAAAGLALPLIGNNMLEQATLQGGIRAERASAAAVSAVSGQTESGSRVEEAILTGVSLHPPLEPQSYLVGLTLLFLLVVVALRAVPANLDRGPAVVAALGVAALYVFRFARGPGFVPGLVASTPLVVFGLVHGWRLHRARPVLAIALLALPVVWSFQYAGGASPQWAGRYILISGLLVGAVGVVVLPAVVRWAQVGAVALALVVTAFGLAWLSVRSHDVARASLALARRPEPVLVSRVGHLAREGGAVHDLRRWLTALNHNDEQRAAAIVRAAGYREFGLVQLEELAPRSHDIAGYRRVGVDRIRFFSGVDLVVTTYRVRS